MSHRALLIAAVALMAGGLLLGGLGAVLSSAEAPSTMRVGPGWRQAPPGGFRPGFGPGAERGPGIGKRVPFPAASPPPSPSANP